MKNLSRLLVMTVIFFSGCGSMATTQPSAEQTQNDALNDPMDYKPSMNHNISGGDITHFDRDGFKQDMNDALNP